MLKKQSLLALLVAFFVVVAYAEHQRDSDEGNSKDDDEGDSSAMIDGHHGRHHGGRGRHGRHHCRHHHGRHHHPHGGDASNEAEEFGGYMLRDNEIHRGDNDDKMAGHPFGPRHHRGGPRREHRGGDDDEHRRLPPPPHRPPHGRHHGPPPLPPPPPKGRGHGHHGGPPPKSSSSSEESGERKGNKIMRAGSGFGGFNAFHPMRPGPPHNFWAPKKHREGEMASAEFGRDGQVMRRQPWHMGGFFGVPHWALMAEQLRREHGHQGDRQFGPMERGPWGPFGGQFEPKMEHGDGQGPQHFGRHDEGQKHHYQRPPPPKSSSSSSSESEEQMAHNDRHQQRGKRVH